MVRKVVGLSSVQRATNLIRERISDGDWGPGHRLVESDLTAEFEISRGPLREAFGRLASEGLLTIEPYKGAMVRKLSSADLVSLYQVREVLEGLAARLVAARVGESDVRIQIAELLENSESLGENPDRQDFFDNNSKLHHSVVELSGNTHLLEATARFETHLYRFSMRRMLDSTSMAQSRHEHIGVLRAILEGAGDTAERLMREHVSESGRVVVQVLLESESRRQSG